MSRQNSKKKPSSKFLSLSGAGVQMGVIIGGFAWLGNWLDNHYQNSTSWWTLGLCLFGVFIGLFIMIKEVIAISKDENNEAS